MRKRLRSDKTSPVCLTRHVLRAGDPAGQPAKLRPTSGSQAPPEETWQTKLPVLVRYSRLCFPGFVTRSVDRGMHPSTQNTPVETCHPPTTKIPTISIYHRIYRVSRKRCLAQGSV